MLFGLPTTIFATPRFLLATPPRYSKIYLLLMRKSTTVANLTILKRNDFPHRALRLL
jgi:hypothetical protein